MLLVYTSSYGCILVLKGVYRFIWVYTVTNEGYKVKYSPLLEGPPKGKGLCLTVYPVLSHNTHSI